MKPRRLALLFLAGLFLYLGLYTWNLRTGHLDSVSSALGLEFTTWVLRPGKWVADKTGHLLDRYVRLVEVELENERLRDENQRLALKNVALSERAQAAARLERLLDVTPPPGWEVTGARVVGKRMGPAAALDTILLDKGGFTGVKRDIPVITPDGVVGRVMRVSMTASSVLLLQDPNSRIPLIGQTTRTQGVGQGHGLGQELTVEYVNLNAPVEPGEVLVTSGVAGIYPKGLPVAVVTEVERSDISLFLSIKAKPLVDPNSLEEVLLLDLAPAPVPGED